MGMPTQANMVETDISVIEFEMPYGQIESFRPLNNTCTWFFDDHGQHWVKLKPLFRFDSDGWQPLPEGIGQPTYTFPADSVVRVEHNNESLDNTITLDNVVPLAKAQPSYEPESRVLPGDQGVIRVRAHLAGGEVREWFSTEMGLPIMVDHVIKSGEGVNEIRLSLPPGWRFTPEGLRYSAEWL